jgi:hypothetical protein
MYLSLPVRTAATDWRDRNQALFAFLRGITVEFSGMTAGPRPSTFTATGVVVRVTANAADIVTAKHNLSMAGGDAPDPADHFTGHVRARLYDAGGTRVADSPIASVHIPDDADAADGGYDAIVVRVTHQPFRQAVQNLVAPGGPGDIFRPVAYAAEGWVMRLTTAERARAVLTDGHPYPGVESADYAGFELVQLGYGKHRGDIFGFEHRVLPVTGLAGPLFVDQTHEGWEDVFTFNTDDSNTGASGDSGGPIFAVGPAPYGPPAPLAPGQPQVPLKRALALVGVHSGANYFANAADDPGPDGDTVNNAITRISERLTLPG